MKDDPREPPRKSTVIKRQFWRESEGCWVDAVLIRRDDVAFTNPDRAKWRHYTITTTVEVSDFMDGQGRR